MGCCSDALFLGDCKKLSFSLFANNPLPCLKIKGAPGG